MFFLPNYSPVLASMKERYSWLPENIINQLNEGYKYHKKNANSSEKNFSPDTKAKTILFSVFLV
jgi:hypothetical protein